MVAVCAGLALACSLRGRAVHHFASPFDPFRLYRAELCAKRKQGVKLNFSMRKKELKSWRHVMRSLFLRIPASDAAFRGKDSHWIERTIYNPGVFCTQCFAAWKGRQLNLRGSLINRCQPLQNLPGNCFWQ